MGTESYYTSGRKIEDACCSWSKSTHCKGATTLSIRKRKSYVLDQSRREIPWGMPWSSAVQNGKHADKNMQSPTSKRQKMDKKQMSGSSIGSEGYKHCSSSVLSLSSNINYRNLDRNEKVGLPSCGVSKRKFLDARKFRELFTTRSRKDMLLGRGQPEATHQSPKEGMLCSLPTETRTISKDSTAERSMCLKQLKTNGPPKGNPKNEASSGSLSLKPDKESPVISEESKRENDATVTTAEEREIAICLEHLKKADTSSGGPKNVASSGNLSLEPDRECQVVSEESRRENDAVETTAVEREIAICLDQLNKTYTSKSDLDTPLWTPSPGPEIDAQVIFDESKRETGTMETTSTIKETVLSHGQLDQTDTSNDDPKNLALSENLSPEPDINPEAVSYRIKPSEASQTVQNEHVDIQNLNELAVTENPIGTRSEVHDENVAEVWHHNTRIPPISSKQPLIGPSRHTLLPSSQPTACANPHAEHNWHNLPARLGLHTYNSNEMQTSSEPAQVLPLRPSRCIPLDGSNTHLTACRSTTVPDSAVAPFLSFSVRPEMSLPLCTNSLQNEMQRIEEDKEQAIKSHEELVQHLNSERKREIDEVQKKYDALLQDAEVALSQKRKAFETNYNKVYLNNFLAKVFSEKHKNSQTAGSQERASISVVDLLELMLRQTEQIVASELGQSLPNIPRVSSNVSPPVHIISNSSHLQPTRDDLNCESGQLVAQRPEQSPANMPMVGTSASPPMQIRNISASALRATQDKPNCGSKFRPPPSLFEAYFTTMPGQEPPCSLSASSSQLTSCLPTQLSELYSVNQKIEKMGGQLPISQSSLEMYLGVDFIAHALNSGPTPRSGFSF